MKLVTCEKLTDMKLTGFHCIFRRSIIVCFNFPSYFFANTTVSSFCYCYFNIHINVYQTVVNKKKKKKKKKLEIIPLMLLSLYYSIIFSFMHQNYPYSYLLWLLNQCFFTSFFLPFNAMIRRLKEKSLVFVRVSKYCVFIKSSRKIHI